MTFVKFIGVDGHEVWCAVEAITAIRKDQGGTAIYAGRRDFWVRETPDVVLSTIRDAEKEAKTAPPVTTPAEGKAK